MEFIYKQGVQNRQFIADSFFCSNDESRASEVTGLAPDELETLLGRFKANSYRAGKMRGEVVILLDESIFIRHHFSKKILWVKQ